MWIRITGVKFGLKEKDFLILRRRKNVDKNLILFFIGTFLRDICGDFCLIDTDPHPSC